MSSKLQTAYFSRIQFYILLSLQNIEGDDVERSSVAMYVTADAKISDI